MAWKNSMEMLSGTCLLERTGETGVEENVDRRATERCSINRDRRAVSLHFLAKSLASPVWLHPNRPSDPLEFDPIHFREVVSRSVHLISTDESPSIARRNDHYLDAAVSLFKDHSANYEITLRFLDKSLEINRQWRSRVLFLLKCHWEQRDLYCCLNHLLKKKWIILREWVINWSIIDLISFTWYASHIKGYSDIEFIKKNWLCDRGFICHVFILQDDLLT